MLSTIPPQKMINFLKPFMRNSRKSVTWSAVPDAPKLVCVGMRFWEGKRQQRGRWPIIPHRAIFSGFRPYVPPSKPQNRLPRLQMKPFWPQKRPLRPQIRPFRPQISPFLPHIRPLRPQIRPFKPFLPQIRPLRPQIRPFRPQIRPLRPKIRPFRPQIKPFRP